MSGSRVAAIFGVHPWLTAFDLWAEIKGGGLPGNNNSGVGGSGDLRKLMGICFEPGLLNIWTHITGRLVIPNSKTLRHPTNPLVIGTPDGLIDGELTGIDAKVVAPDQARKWGTEADDLPMHITMQAWWYLLLMNFNAWIIAALVGGWLRFYTIYRDIEVERVMLERVTEWWERYIVGNEQPPFGGSTEAAHWLQRRYPVHRSDSIREATPEETELLDQYVIARVAQNKLDALRNGLETEIKAAIKDDEGLRWNDGCLFTWRKRKDSMVVNWKAMAVGFLQKDFDNEQARIDHMALHTNVKENGRSIHITHPSLGKDAPEPFPELAAR